MHSYSTLSSLPFTRDRSKIETVFIKAIAQHNQMAVGMYHFLNKVVVGRWEGETKGEEVLVFLKWGADVVKECVWDGLDM